MNAGPIDDDPELAKMIDEQNAEIVAENDGKVPDVTAPAEAQVSSNPEPVQIDVNAPLEEIKDADELSEIEEFDEEDLQIKPAETLAEFRDAIALAKINGLEQIEASKKVIYHFTKPAYPKDHFFYFEGIRVIETGKAEYVAAFMTKSIDEVVFGKRA
jgi:hypothetical protein